jgi:sulfate adenylyltransferase subunit 1 (EFTu-like GTPase family)
LTARVEAASAAHGMVKYSSEAKRNNVPNIVETTKNLQASFANKSISLKYERDLKKSKRLILAFLKFSFTSNHNGRGDCP